MNGHNMVLINCRYMVYSLWFMVYGVCNRYWLYDDMPQCECKLGPLFDGIHVSICERRTYIVIYIFGE